MTTSNAIRLADSACDKATGVGEREEVVGQEQPAMLVHRIDDHARRRLAARVAAAISLASQSASPLEAQFKLRGAGRPIALEAFGRPFLRAARAHLARGGIVRYENLPVTEGAHAVPTDGRPTTGQALAAVISQATTESLGYAQEDNGLTYQRLYPVAGVTNAGRTPGELHMHVDDPFLRPWAMPEVIHLVCVNNDAQASTKFMTMGGVLRGLREGFGDAVVDLLQQPKYVTAISNSFVSEGLSKSVTTRPRPVLDRRRSKGGPTHFLAKAFDISVAPGVEGFDRYERALAAYVSVLKDRPDLAFFVNLRPDTALSFNQVRLVHGRGPIGSSKYRELVRAYGRFSLTVLLAHLGVVPPRYVFDASALIDN